MSLFTYIEKRSPNITCAEMDLYTAHSVFVVLFFFCFPCQNVPEDSPVLPETSTPKRHVPSGAEAAVKVSHEY